ncbi:MAG: mechanosensitive ion channel [Nitrospiraceae bacterium]|nr:mechanosensitive ion channel [Nitrospiraceae bacterium]
MESLQQLFIQIKSFLDIPVFSAGKSSITLWTLVVLVILILLLFSITRWLKVWIVTGLLAKSSVELGVRLAISAIVRYIIIAVGLIVILQTTGIDLSTVTILAGALGVGVGFGLQNITNNFVSGFILLIERPIKVGDRIEVGPVTGDVVNISLRATTVVTNDNIAIIVPNSEFVSSRVINWSYTDRSVRFNFPVGVSYRSDPELVRRLLLQVADQHAGVLKDPKPDALLQEFGDSALNFILRVWTKQHATTPGMLRSELNFMILKTFKEQGIEIPYPQRDLHIRSGGLDR